MCYLSEAVTLKLEVGGDALPALGAYMNDNLHSIAWTGEAAFGNPRYSPQPSAEHDAHAGVHVRTAGEEPLEGTTSADASYDLRRASEERTAALQARDVKVRRVHIELAERYEERIRNSTAARSQLWL